MERWQGAGRTVRQPRKRLALDLMQTQVRVTQKLVPSPCNHLLSIRTGAQAQATQKVQRMELPLWLSRNESD